MFWLLSVRGFRHALLMLVGGLLLAAYSVAPAFGEGLVRVRYPIASSADIAFLKSHPELEVVFPGPDMAYVDLVTTNAGVAALRQHRRPFEMLRDGAERASNSTVTPCFIGARTLAQVVAFMDTLRMFYPSVVSARWSLGQSHEGRDIWCFRMSDSPDVDQGRVSVLFDALHHPGECASYELVIRFAEYLAQQYGNDPQVTYLLDHREVYFVPIVNPDGLAFIEAGNSWPKKNRRDNGDGTFGVNLNDNYPFMWGVSSGGNADSTGCACYHGPYAGSEPETQAVIGLVNSHNFVTHQSYHTPGRISFYPWAYTTDPTPDDATFAQMAAQMTLVNGYLAAKVTDVVTPFSGSTIDWSYGAQTEHPKIFAFTNEVGSSFIAQTPEQALQEILDDNISGALYLMRVAGPFLSAAEPSAVGGNGDDTLDPGETAGISFTLTNEGVREAASAVTVTLSTDDPYLRLLTAEREIGVLQALSSMDFAGNSFAVEVDPTCPIGRAIHVTVTVEHTEGPQVYDLIYVAGGRTVLVQEDFESGSDGWTLDGGWAVTTERKHSPSHSLTDSPGTNYADVDTTSATFGPITTAALDLEFWHRYWIEEGYDVLRLQVSSDGGSWTTLRAYTGSTGPWQPVTLSLDAYAGAPVEIRFELATDGSWTEEGYYLDDLVLRGSLLTNRTPPPPVLLSPLTGEEVDEGPALTVMNSSDPEGGGALTYGFRVYGDEQCTVLAAAVDGIEEGTGQTSWTVPDLPNATYWWRAYAGDSVERGLMGEKRSFVKKALVPVLIQRFDATAIDAGVRLMWEILADEAVSGFNLYRRDASQEAEQRINTEGLVGADVRSFDDTHLVAHHTYTYTLGVAKANGVEFRSAPVTFTPSPRELAISSGVPNPFNPATTLTYSLPAGGRVRVVIYDVHGRSVVTLVDESKGPGNHTLEWNGSDSSGARRASGVYFARLEFNGLARTTKLVLLK